MTLTTSKQVRAIASPVRLEVISFLVSLGPCTVAELAAAMDRPADGLYPHLRALVHAGVAVAARREPGPGEGRGEAVFDAAADHFSTEWDEETGRGTAAFMEVSDAVLRAAGLGLRRAFEARAVRLTGDKPNLTCMHESGWVDEETLAKVMGHLREARRLLVEGRTQRRGQLVQMTTVLVPTVRKRGAAERE